MTGFIAILHPSVGTACCCRVTSAAQSAEPCAGLANVATDPSTGNQTVAGTTTTGLPGLDYELTHYPPGSRGLILQAFFDCRLEWWF